MSFAQQVAEIVWRKAGLDPDESMFSDHFLRDEFAEYLEKTLKPVKVKIPYCTIDGGDGSAYPAVFKTQAGADRREEYEVEEMGYGFCDATGTIQIEVNAAGEVVGGTDYTHCTGQYGDTEHYED